MPWRAPVPPNPGREYLKLLLAERNQNQDRAAEIDARIQQVFGRKVAILVLDMCQFSNMTNRHGIIHYLSMIRQMEDAARPAVEGNGGRVIKQEADNLFATFDDPAHALEAALDILRAFEAVNAVVGSSRNLHGSLGIGFGETLVIGGEDLFGHEMNLACKLGEDLAGVDEILLTPSAHAALPEGRYACSPLSFRVNHFELDCFRFDGPAPTNR